ncbi:MAG: methionyl-tRNA formyltransferase, partial [Candidatus Komeilibacteria bacterium]|nr:methionyl-tRNA formyltransferase [Candidatus Komeilibacteria bacterium]
MTSDGIAIPAINALRRNFSVVVITKPDMPSGRHKVLMPNEIAKYCAASYITHFKLDKHDNQFDSLLEQYAPRLGITFSYGVMLSASLLESLTIINIHPSRLPAFRGPSPIQASIRRGLNISALTYMLTVMKMDAGPILRYYPFTIGSQDTYTRVRTVVANLAGETINEVINDYLQERIIPIPQDESQTTLCRLLTKQDGLIDWHQGAEDIFNQWRALLEWPTIYTRVKGKKITLHEIEVLTNDSHLIPGTFYLYDDKLA